jgi:EAL domain-containing protein (putative c-di-GMP-specific phosphodiesterase class I)
LKFKLLVRISPLSDFPTVPPASLSHPRELRLRPSRKGCIPLAEENGTIVEIGHWAIRQAVGTIATWNRDCREPLKIAVNLSARQFVQNDLVAQVQDALEESGCPAAWLECEITETPSEG